MYNLHAVKEFLYTEFCFDFTLMYDRVHLAHAASGVTLILIRRTYILLNIEWILDNVLVGSLPVFKKN